MPAHERNDALSVGPVRPDIQGSLTVVLALEYSGRDLTQWIPSTPLAHMAMETVCARRVCGLRRLLSTDGQLCSDDHHYLWSKCYILRTSFFYIKACLSHHFISSTPPGELPTPPFIPNPLSTRGTAHHASHIRRPNGQEIVPGNFHRRNNRLPPLRLRPRCHVRHHRRRPLPRLLPRDKR